MGLGAAPDGGQCVGGVPHARMRIATDRFCFRDRRRLVSEVAGAVLAAGARRVAALLLVFGQGAALGPQGGFHVRREVLSIGADAFLEEREAGLFVDAHVVAQWLGRWRARLGSSLAEEVDLA